MKRSAFTLIELLVVIAIIAILSVVIILSLNPAELLRQSRDANRLSDLATLNSAIGLYTTDQASAAGFSLGNASSVYVSLPDSSSTCGTWSLPALPTGYSYACSSSTSSRNINSTGWLPVNFSLMSSGSPFGNLPVDAVNQSSSGLYYTYSTNGTQFIATAVPESQKQKSTFGAKPQIPNYPDVMANGSNLAISPLFNPGGLVGYWPMDEGSGSSTADMSGSNNTGSWLGTPTNGSYYAAGKVGANAGNFNNGNADYVNTTANNLPIGSSPRSVFMWIYFTGINPTGFYWPECYGTPTSGNEAGLFIYNNSGVPQLDFTANTIDAAAMLFPSAPTWHFIGYVYGGGTSITLYIDTSAQITNTFSGPLNTVLPGSNPALIGAMCGVSTYFSGSIDDVRIYNRALSASEVQAIYNAEK